ncbi:hypothetical protein [Paenibacillus sp. GYB003]|uniref:hypothetical protein n=1 Tax=Paenibacillus sp. GYB003 TaxID=2994392 RepID=UPI002F965DEF
MSYICLYCNGMRALDRSCPQCGEGLVDAGRLDDYSGPYSPYRPIDDSKLTNGYPDLAEHLCVHQTYCPDCGYSDVIPLKESTQ